MAKRLTIQEKQVREMTEAHLKELGRKIRITTAINSKVSKKQKRHLRDSVKAQVKPWNTLNISQYYYGKYNTPKGEPTPKNKDNIENTPVKNAIAEFVNDETRVFVKNMVDLLKSPIVKK